MRLVDHGDKTRIDDTSLVRVTEFGDQVKFDNQTSKCNKDSALDEAVGESDEESVLSETDAHVLKIGGEFDANESHHRYCIYNSCLKDLISSHLAASFPRGDATASLPASQK